MRSERSDALGISPRAPKPKSVNPIQAAIKSWLPDLPAELIQTVTLKLDPLIAGAPKRWVVYPPMALLPAGSFGEDWWDIMGPIRLVMSERHKLWKLILDAISKREGKGVLTHLAINSGIPLHTSPGSGLSNHEAGDRMGRLENILRTPSGLIMLYGDFGPSLSPNQMPTSKDFDDAFWVSTKQNGITQIWAPRYTMFSRGNVKEKARLLDFHSSSPCKRALKLEDLSKSMAIDLYAGIGYFVFSYVKMAMSRVIGWELNPWSIEGLRRGAVANGWSIKIVRPHEELQLGNEKIIVLAEDNKSALERLQGLKPDCLGDIRHVNCGLLPTSELSWKMASEVLSGDGWLHLHENVGVEEVQMRKTEIERIFQGWLDERSDARVAKVEHIEFVKTFAPGVWHCVFDVFVMARAIHLKKD